ncbi:hypothetical protein ACVWZZ_008781 [Bradyrhizobium sp. LM6.10]
MKKTAYGYVVLRYVHDVITGEFVNVGLVMHAPDTQQVKSKTRTSIRRLKATFPDLDRTAFVAAMKSVTRALGKVEKQFQSDGMLKQFSDAKSFAHLAVPIDDSSLQWSQVSTGLTDNFDKTFDRVYQRMVTRYDHQSLARRSDEDVWRPVREKIAERKISVPFEEKTIVGATDQIEFRHAWKNGAWHAYEALSLDLADADGIKDKARRWRGHLDAVFEGKNDPNLKLNFILGAPTDPKLISAYENAVAILGHSPSKPKIYREGQIDDLVSEIEDEVRAHAEHSRRT